MKKVFIIILLVCSGLFFYQSNGCPPGGKNRNGAELSGEDAKFNRRKNRSLALPNREPAIISIKALQSGRGNAVHDRDYWYEGSYVEMHDAYLIEFKEGGAESCNCYTNDAMKRDVHINLGSATDLRNKNNDYYVVVEITPAYKRRHPDYKEELKLLIGKKVKVQGFLFYDSEHERNSINYCEACTDVGVWRKTCWEIHPVTFIGPA